ncbi:M56 family metallopeptidase [Gimesia aquarii]|uniref:Regulatory protein BlaR1 n=1 Tax=Gimesia aquarii TaxID=2527964 RepID=A0A517WT10_9PLAN|nr:M56 family metallopeptidase [Gimesia aquarii]QDU08391.1 Regulatory protein BlaR1 [Gimesia aquarii]
MTDLWNEIVGVDTLVLLINVLVQSTVLVILALLAARLLRQRASVQHCLLISALLGLIMIPVLTVVFANQGIGVISVPFASKPATSMPPNANRQPVELPKVTAVPSLQKVVAVNEVNNEGNIESSSTKTPGMTALADPLNLDSKNQAWTHHSLTHFVANVFILIWFMGLCLTLFGIIRSVWKIRRIIRLACPLLLEDQSNIVAQVCRVLNIKSMPPIVCSPDVAGPMMTGIVRPQIILPTRIVAILSENELRNILLHEMAHLLRKDQFVVLLQELVAALYWLNPLVRILNRQLARAREEICDNYVLSTVDPVEYSKTLFRLGQMLPRPRLLSTSVGIFNTDWKLEDRITDLLDERRITMIRMQPNYAAAIVVSVFVLSIVIAGSSIGLAQGSTDPIATEKKESNERKVTSSVQRAIKLLSEHPATPTVQQEQLSLFAIDVATGKVTLVANEPHGNLTYIGSPCWSAQGRQILFDATPGKDWLKTRLIKIDITKSSTETSDLGAGSCPVFSPDGKQIAFLLNSNKVTGAKAGIWLMDSDGTNRRRLGGYGVPKWSPDGRQLLITSFSSPARVTLLDVETGKQSLIQIANHKIFSIPNWAGDGQTIVALLSTKNGHGIALIDVSQPEQAKVKQILWRIGDRLDLKVAYPIFSPTTDRCVFVGKTKAGMALYSVQPGSFDPPQRLESDNLGLDKKIASLTFSPDGRYVLFCSDRNAQAAPKVPIKLNNKNQPDNISKIELPQEVLTLDFSASTQTVDIIRNRGKDAVEQK